MGKFHHVESYKSSWEGCKRIFSWQVIFLHDCEMVWNQYYGCRVFSL